MNYLSSIKYELHEATQISSRDEKPLSKQISIDGP